MSRAETKSPCARRSRGSVGQTPPGLPSDPTHGGLIMVANTATITDVPNGRPRRPKPNDFHPHRDLPEGAFSIGAYLPVEAIRTALLSSSLGVEPRSFSIVEGEFTFLGRRGLQGTIKEFSGGSSPNGESGRRSDAASVSVTATAAGSLERSALRGHGAPDLFAQLREETGHPLSSSLGLLAARALSVVSRPGGGAS